MKTEAQLLNFYKTWYQCHIEAITTAACDYGFNKDSTIGLIWKFHFID